MLMTAAIARSDQFALDKSAVSEIAIDAVTMTHTNISANDLALRSISYGFEDQILDNRSFDYLHVILRLKSTTTIETNGEDRLAYYKSVQVEINSDGSALSVSEIRNWVDHFDGHGGHMGPSADEDVILSPLLFGRSEMLAAFSSFQSNPTLRDVLQTFANLTQETIVIAKHLNPDDRVPVHQDVPPKTEEDAIKSIISILGAQNIVISPVDENRSRVHFRTLP